jgi:UDP-N-acetylmuramoyl-tripeptide--D-alanyl-D-alanine ligase
VGELSRHAVHAYGEGARHFASHEQLCPALLQKLTAQTTVLVKGSRSMHMEAIVDALLNEDISGSGTDTPTHRGETD